MAKTFTLDAFKEAVKTDLDFRDGLAGTSDSIDFDNGSAIIHKENVNRYLEKYMCKNERDLEGTLWYGYGVYVKIV